MINVFDTLQARGYIKRTSDDRAVRELLGSPPATLYQGFDPTAASLHIGHYLGLMAFHYLQQAGHRMIFLVGGGTGIVGDPSGQSESRRKMTLEDIRRNANSLRRQVQALGLVDFENGKPSALLLNNADWLNMPLFDYLEQVAPHFSVNVMVKQDTFARRLNEQKNLSLFEFMYPTLQGFDFLFQFDHYDCRIQVGGDDQWGNLVAGLDLIQNVRHERAHVMTFPLLVDAAGQKIGKTTGGKAIWLDSARTSPFEFYQYWINSPDEDQDRNFRLLTFVPLEEITKILAGDRRAAARRLAYEITRIVHGEAAAKQAEADSHRAFHVNLEGRLNPAGTLVAKHIRATDNANESEMPKDVPTIEISAKQAAEGVSLIDLLVQAGLRSRGEARRLIEGGGVQINGERVTDPRRALSQADLVESGSQQAALVRYGKGKVVKVQLAL